MIFASSKYLSHSVQFPTLRTRLALGNTTLVQYVGRLLVPTGSNFEASVRDWMRLHLGRKGTSELPMVGQIGKFTAKVAGSRTPSPKSLFRP